MPRYLSIVIDSFCYFVIVLNISCCFVFLGPCCDQGWPKHPTAKGISSFSNRFPFFLNLWRRIFQESCSESQNGREELFSHLITLLSFFAVLVSLHMFTTELFDILPLLSLFT